MFHIRIHIPILIPTAEGSPHIGAISRAVSGSYSSTRCIAVVAINTEGDIASAITSGSSCPEFRGNGREFAGT